MAIELRPVNDSDQEFLVRVYVSTREQELAMVSWSPEQKEAFVRSQFAAQSLHYNAKYPGAEHSLICLDGEPVGKIFLARLPERFAIADLAVLPEHRHAGIGSHVLRKVLEQAQEARKPVFIYVETFNPSLRLFEKLGFEKMKEEDFNYLLKWEPEIPNASPL